MEDAWRLTSASARELALSVYAQMDTFWREHDRLPHQPTVGKHTEFGEEHRAWFEVCVEGQLLPEELDKLRATQFGHKDVGDVDFSRLYENSNWLATPRIALTLMAAAKQLEQDFSKGGEEWSHREALRGEAQAAWIAQGPASSLQSHSRLEPSRERGWYWNVRDCFTAISQRIAAGIDPRPMTYVELWAWCLVFDEAETFIQDELHMNAELRDQHDALPTNSCDEDMDITRASLLGPYSTPTPPPAHAPDSDGDSDDEDDPKYVHGLPLRPIARWFEPLPVNMFQVPLA